MLYRTEIQRCKGLVQQGERGAGGKRGGQPEFSPHAHGKRIERFVQVPGQLKRVQMCRSHFTAPPLMPVRMVRKVGMPRQAIQGVTVRVAPEHLVLPSLLVWRHRGA